MPKRRIENWLALVIGLALIPAAVLGLWLWAGATATILHPNPKDVPNGALGVRE